MKKILLFLLSLVTCLSTVALFSLSSSRKVEADTGPKPTTTINITNLPRGDYITGYGVKEKTYFGPHHVFIPGDEEFGDTYFGDANDLTILYNNVSLPDGWNLSDISSHFEDSSSFELIGGYYWPSTFILIIYNKNNSSYLLSEETSTYAFNSYFSFDYLDYASSGSTFFTLDQTIELKRSYNYCNEVLSFLLRVVITLVIELLISLCFNFTKKSYLVILITNLVTQGLLNLVLNIATFYWGRYVLLVPLYIMAELAIFLIEGFIYKKFVKRMKENSSSLGFLYSFIANLASFLVGCILWLAL